MTVLANIINIVPLIVSLSQIFWQTFRNISSCDLLIRCCWGYCYALPALWPTSGLHCSNYHEYFHWLNYLVLITVWSIFFSFSLQWGLWTRTVAISHVFSLIIMMIVSVYIMAQCAAADTGDSGDISHVVILPIVTFAISTLFIATLFGQAAGWLETTHSGFHSMTFLLERLFSK